MEKHTAELEFMRKTFISCKLKSLILTSNEHLDARMDQRLRHSLGFPHDYELSFSAALRNMSRNTLYHMIDRFNYNYQFFYLNDHTDEIFWIGPYFEQEYTHEDILMAAELYQIPIQWVQEMERFFSVIPVIHDNSPIHAMIYNYCTLIFGNEFNSVDLNREMSDSLLSSEERTETPKPQDIAKKMKIIERRYYAENELMKAVSRGMLQKGSLMIGQLSNLIFEQRTPDALRNIKNYCIIMNTLLRKAAEHGGVHPIYLHEISSNFAKKIESLPNTSAVKELMTEMFYGYCRLVNSHATDHYSLPIQKTIIYIDSDLTADLSLKALASAQNLSPGYLSGLFKKETGYTLTEFVTRRRIYLALSLLTNTPLQIQTIAHRCGIPDVNYFSKVFKRYVTKSPSEYRKSFQVQ